MAVFNVPTMANLENWRMAEKRPEKIFPTPNPKAHAGAVKKGTAQNHNWWRMPKLINTGMTNIPTPKPIKAAKQ